MMHGIGAGPDAPQSTSA